MSPRTSFRAIALRRLGSASAAEIQGTVQETAYLRGTRGTYFHGWYRTFILQVMKKLEQADYLKSQPARNEKNEEVPLYRLRLEKVIWKPGNIASGSYVLKLLDRQNRVIGNERIIYLP